MKRFITFFAFTTLISSCSLFEKATLTVSPTVYECDCSSTTLQLKLATNQEWTLSSNQSWAVPNITVGVPNDTLIRVKISTNGEYDERKAILTFSSKKCDPVCVTIIQGQKNAIILDAFSKEFGQDGGSFDVTVQANVNYSIQIPTEALSWLSLVSTKGLTSTTKTFNVAPNSSTEDRRASIILTDNNNISTSISVYQKGRTFAMSISHSNTQFAAPLLDGLKSITGTILWGDGVQEEYSTDASHTYESAGSHTVSIEASGVSSASIGNIVGVSEISFDKY